MRALRMLLGSFLLTFAALSLVWTTMVGGGKQRVAEPTQTPIVTSPAPTARPTEAAASAPSREPASPVSTNPATPVPTASPGSTSSSTPSSTPSARLAETQTYVLVGGAYMASELTDGGAIVPSGDGIALETEVDDSDPVRVTYLLDATELPTGATVARVDVRVCGSVTGTDYELDGPLGSSQSTRVSVPPEADGCWHLEAQAPTALSVTAAAASGARLVVLSVEYTVTIER